MAHYLKDTTKPGTPSSGLGALYVNGDSLFFKDDNGNETELGAPGYDYYDDFTSALDTTNDWTVSGGTYTTDTTYHYVSGGSADGHYIETKKNIRGKDFIFIGGSANNYQLDIRDSAGTNTSIINNADSNGTITRFEGKWSGNTLNYTFTSRIGVGVGSGSIDTSTWGNTIYIRLRNSAVNSVVIDLFQWKE